MTQNLTVYNPFSNKNRTESDEQNSFNTCITFVRFKNFALLYSRVGAGAGARAAGATTKFSPGAGAA
jgi:hypothetical protein